MPYEDMLKHMPLIGHTTWHSKFMIRGTLIIIVLREKEGENYRSPNFRCESGPSRARGHMEVDLSLQKYSTPEDDKSFALKRLEA
jgi:hypothetical protein